MWINRRSELRELEAELYEWSNRFDVKLLALPAEFKFMLPASEGCDAPTPPIVRANIQLQEFLALPQEVRDKTVETMLEIKFPEEIIRAIANYTSLKPVEVGNKQFILASRKFPPDINPDTAEFHKLVSRLGQLAVALNRLDPGTNISLLNVAHYPYDVPTRQFIFAQTPPYHVISMKSLEILLDKSPFPRVYAPLNQRLQVAHKLAEAVFFLHTAGFVHKNVSL
ncbi:hypothetical protein B0I35DRAFT_445210 [Stachybotrys elegans]|uniref:Protein kinase domain-containing protein n=1 Tax=Stachybotrys elegans TaxID=80388 RepID=A0A8K0SI45_9HYPO|nr:hypothetical protein B0I35DRAFT_445210 [Stachybotrys elegans]